jgi:hypothetical protein
MGSSSLLRKLESKITLTCVDELSLLIFPETIGYLSENLYAPDEFLGDVAIGDD